MDPLEGGAVGVEGVAPLCVVAGSGRGGIEFDAEPEQKHEFSKIK